MKSFIFMAGFMIMMFWLASFFAWLTQMSLDFWGL